MEQKTLLAIVISIAVIVGWSWLFPPPPTAKKDQEKTVAVEENKKTVTQGEQIATVSESTLPETKVETAFAKSITIDTPYYRAVIDTRGGVLKSLLLKNYKNFKESISLGKWIPYLSNILGRSAPTVVTEDNLLQMIKTDFIDKAQTLAVQFEENPELSKAFRNTVFSSDRDSISIDSRGKPEQLVLISPVQSGIQIIKTLTFHANDFAIDYKVSLINRDKTVRPLEVKHFFGEGHTVDPGVVRTSSHKGPVYVYNNDLETLDTDDLEQTPGRISQMQWLGVEDSYFISAAAGLTPVNHGFIEAHPIFEGGKRVLKPVFGMTLPPVDLNPNKQIESSFALYYGPKVESEMMKFGRNLVLSHDLTLEALAKPLLNILTWIHSYVGNYGVSIVFLTILVRLCLFPLTYKGSKSMKRMQQLQPKMVKLRERLKDNKEKLNAEMMDLYKKNKVNPVGGCFPVLLQLPIFFALYSALSTAVELRHEPFFGWIVDLSAPDGLGITPILMGISMFGIQKMTPTGMMDPTQAKIMSMLPIVFTFFTFTFPTGLTIYWVTSNILSLGQQYFINRIKVPEMSD
ncbi:MAG: membrane protein insertase YidC [SAR324 cluster bacterium]|nr:membrane protein insertase YidC [SAR324 cluster bacterium]